MNENEGFSTVSEQTWVEGIEADGKYCREGIWVGRTGCATAPWFPANGTPGGWMYICIIHPGVNLCPSLANASSQPLHCASE